MAARHRPSFCLRILTEVIKSADLMEGQAIRMDENLSFFEEQVGTCERCGRTRTIIDSTYMCRHIFSMVIPFKA